MHLVLAIVLAMTTASPSDKPYLGMMLDPTALETEFEGQTLRHGLVVRWLQPGCGAADAGVILNDVIVGVEGIDFDCPTGELLSRFQSFMADKKIGDVIVMTLYRNTVEQLAHIGEEEVADPQAWETPDCFVAERPPGTELLLRAKHVEKLVTLSVTLGPRMETDGMGWRAIPPNEEIFAEPVRLPDEYKLAEMAVNGADMREDYNLLLDRLARLVNKGDAFRLTRLAYVFRQPFALPPLSRKLADIPNDPEQALYHAAEWLDLVPEKLSYPPLRTGISPKEHAEQIEFVLKVAAEFYEDAFSNVTEQERKILKESLDDVSESFKDVVMVLHDPNATRLAGVQRFVEIVQKVDVGKLVSSAACLSQLLDTDYLSALRSDLMKHDRQTILAHDTPFGPIIFTGSKNNWHRRSAAVLVDLGGNDFFASTTLRPFSVIIDLEGDDLHQATFDYSQGAGILGISLLFDLEGNDIYIGQQYSQGSAAAGVGILWDASGNDTYRSADYSQASALCGVGILVDEKGDDRYDSPRYSQALGMPGGFAALVDRKGNDDYYCSGRDATVYGTVGAFDAFGQGCGIGFRRLASGGIGLLLDEQGDDTYFAGNFAQGGGYYFGWGALVDRGGDDRYVGSRYAQAWAAHQAVGFLEDHDGNDVYLAKRTVGQSCSWDETVTALIDHRGDDHYSGGDFALCASHNNGFALLCDYDGKDNYGLLNALPRADGDENVTSFSLLLDLGNGRDIREDGTEMPQGVTSGERNTFLMNWQGTIDGLIEHLKAKPQASSK